MTNRLNAMLLGSCLVRRPFQAEPGIDSAISYNPKIPAVHSFGEMFQLLDFLQGKKQIPPDLWPLCRIPRKLATSPRVENFDMLDVALVEPSLPVEFVFRDTVINRDGVLIEVLGLIDKKNKPAQKLGNKWLRQGLMTSDEDARMACAAELVNFIPDDAENAELARAVIRETYGKKSDLAGGFRKIREMLGCPLGAVIYIFGYMPDGRTMSWPPGFREDVLAAAAQENLPLFEPTELVRAFGIDAALNADNRHYSEAFLPVAGEALLKFAQQVHAGSHTSA